MVYLAGAQGWDLGHLEKMVATARKACGHLRQCLLARALRSAAGEAGGAPGEDRSGTSGEALTITVEHDQLARQDVPSKGLSRGTAGRTR